MRRAYPRSGATQSWPRPSISLSKRKHGRSLKRSAFSIARSSTISRSNCTAISFIALAALELGIRLGALSVDHLEASGPEQIAKIAASSTIATILPGVSLHLGIPAASGRKLIDAGAAVAVGTDLNPGSSPLFSTSEALALSVRLNGLTAPEALVAGTVNAACALGLNDAGRLEDRMSRGFPRTAEQRLARPCLHASERIRSGTSGLAGRE